MKADKPLSERQRIEAENQREIRAALARRYVEILDEHYAIKAVHIALDTRSPEFQSLAGKLRG